MSFLKYAKPAMLVLLAANTVACGNNETTTKIKPVSVAEAEVQTALQTHAIKAVVVTMYESGDAMGDDAGELQLWLERGDFSQKLDFPLGEYDLYLNKDGVLVICVGGGIPNATASIMALGLDPRFDLSKAYWVVAGIAGGDPEDLSLGSAAWAKHVVDGDLIYQIDAREIPDSWPYGIIPLGATEPAEEPADISTGWTLDTVSFDLNSQLADWAFSQTKDIQLPDSEGIKTFRELYKTMPNAQKPPFVTMGDTLSASKYWHGKHLNEWANDWLTLYGGDSANFMTSNMEDSGTLTSLMRLARIGKVDPQRVMVLRTVSNYTMAPADKLTSWSVTAPYPDGGYPAKNAAYIVGNTVIQEIVKNWSSYESALPYDVK
ncbi:purine nucleoside permease [Aliiglaciecola sp. 3_MG-2023]|uniref:purine-nucleoside phosphorylase n=1 Tax=Aliiglaciecola sp. 3_MG-2023 TaxID=3062644 RepID=UPI0026E21889|nr:purine nucleoside permease [Aliiglaciecola sp. 3_MG-2023]MDO6694516.1 purine nucleoside permease [Aliiglaciecola sp. 3_MG-2023]